MIGALHALAINLLAAGCFALPPCAAIGGLAWAFRRELATWERAASVASDNVGRGHASS